MAVIAMTLYVCQRCTKTAYTKTTSTGEWVCEPHYSEIERGW